MTAELSKQEYLKRYLEDNDKDKKRKKKIKSTKSVIPRIKILDNDIGIKSINFGTKEEIEEDENPVVAEVIDERPVEVKLKEIYESSRWKKLGEDDSQVADVSNNPSNSLQSNGKDTKKNFASNSVQSLHKKKLDEGQKTLERYKTSKKQDSGTRLSPSRFNRRHDSDSDVSPPRKQNTHIEKRRHDSDSDVSPPRKQNTHIEKRLHDSDSDVSPPRKQNTHIEKRRHDSDSDVSPPRKQNTHIEKRRHDSDSDNNSCKKNVNRTLENADSKNHSLSKHKINQKHDSDSDISLPRKQNSHTEKRQRYDSDSDNINSKKSGNKTLENTISKKHPSSHKRISSSSSYHKSHCNDSNSDLSPVRKTIYSKKSNTSWKKDSDSDLSPEREHPRSTVVDSDGDLSPPRERAQFSSKNKNQRPSKTLSGLKAGLQNATTLREENKELREREKTQIRQLDAELSGRNAGTVVRDRQTGLKRDIDQEMRLKEREERKKSEQQQKYSEWGKGVEQTENRKSKLTEDLYEMSKPLARYCDDEDLEERLKSEIRDDDPMAQYMRKKRQKDVVSAYPMYSGPPPPPNRFGIPPGYRWDGVDRSNGFEKKYFEQKSNKHAGEEEAYLWSIQDM